MALVEFQAGLQRKNHGKQAQSTDIPEFDALCLALSYLCKPSLSAPSLTCWRWNAACNHPGVWSLLKVGEEIHTPMYDITALLGPRVRLLRRVNLANSFGLLSGAGLRRLADECPGISFLDTGSSGALDEASILYMAERCSKLECLYMCQCDGVTDRAIQAILRGCPHLLTLHISECHNVTSQSMTEGGPLRLTSLGIRDTGINIDTLGSVLKFTKDISKLWCTRMSSSTLMDCLRYNPSVTELHVKDASQISSSAMQQFLKSNTKMIALGLRGFQHGGSTAFLNELNNSAPTLEYLALSDCEEIFAEDLLPLLKNCKALKSLIMSPISDKGVGKDFWKEISKSCPNFSQLFVTSSKGLKDAPLLGLSECSKLRRLSLFSCGLSPVVQLPQSSPIWTNVKHLSFAYNGEVTDLVVCDALKYCLKLEALDVDNTIVSDLTLHALREHGKTVVFLNISGCTKITLGGLQELQYCTQLVSLRCTNLSLQYQTMCDIISPLHRLRFLGFTTYGMAPAPSGRVFKGIRKLEMTSPLVSRTISSEWIRHVASEFCNVSWLVVHNSTLKKEDLAVFLRFPLLNSIELSGTEYFDKQDMVQVCKEEERTCSVFFRFCH